MSREDRQQSLGEDLGIHMLPLLDVMFLLLCFFIYAITMMVIQQGIAVELAAAETGEQTREDPSQIVLSIDGAGELYWNDRPITMEEAGGRLGALENNPPIILQADREARHHQVVEILDLVRTHELTNLIFAVEEPGG